MTTHGRMGDNASGLQSLYPFLYDTKHDLGAVLEQVRRSSEEKVREIVALRDLVETVLSGKLTACATALAEYFATKGKLLTFGNGGSATDAQAFAHLFFQPPTGQPLPALSLTNDMAVVTALANDVGFEVAFARQIAACGTAGDVAVGMSTSGNSANVLQAFDEGAWRGLLTIGFAGYDGGKMAETDSIAYLFVIPSASVHRIQEAQTTLYHVLWELTQEVLLEHQGG